MKKFIIPILMLCLMQAGIAKAESTDISTLDNVIYVSPATIESGSTAKLSICMKNTADIRGFQFDLYLPEGVTVVKSGKGRIQGSLTANRLPDEDEHDLTFSQQEDGAVRFLCSSQYDETFTGNDGEIATLQVKIATDMAPGDYEIVLKSIKLTETDISKYYETATVVSTLTITGEATGIDGIQVRESKGSCYNLSGQRLSAPKKGINIISGRKVVKP